MKKALWLGLLLCLLFSFAACGTTETQTCKVSFVSEGEIVQTIETESGTELDPSAAARTPAKPEDETYVYTFKGWSLTEGGEIVTTYTVTEDVTFYAVYEKTEKGEPPVAKLTVTFKNGSETVKTLEVEKGASLTLSQAAGTPQKPEDETYVYTFKGWSLTEDGEIVSTYTVTENVTFYAVFEKTEKGEVPPAAQLTVTFKNGNNVFKTVTVGKGEEIELSETAGIPVKPSQGEFDYLFKGWSLTEGGETVSTYTVTENVTFYAVFEEKEISFTVKFVDEWEGGSAEISSVKVKRGQLASAPTENIPEHEGYTFTGWTPDVNRPITADTTFKAVYEKERYTLSLHVLGKVTETALSFGAETSLTANLPDFVTLDGWYFDESFETEANLTSMPARDVDVYAKCTLAAPTGRLSAAGNFVYGGTNRVEIKDLLIAGGLSYSYAWSDGAGGVYGNGSSVSLKDAGEYALQATVTASYATLTSQQTLSQTFTVAKKALTGTLSVPNSTYVYGVEEVTPKLAFSGLTAGDAQLEIPAEISVQGPEKGESKYLPVGSYTVSASVAQTLKNYELSPISSVTFEVTKKTLYVSVTAEDVTYGQSPAPALAYTGLLDGEDGSVVSVGEGAYSYSKGGEPYTEERLAAGSYVLAVDPAKLTAENYAFNNKATCVFSVKKAALTAQLVLSSASFVYGEAVEPAMNVSGFVYGESLSSLGAEPVYFYGGYTAPFPVGSHTVTGRVVGLANYNNVEATESFQVTQKQLTVKIAGVQESYVYGAKISPELTYEGFVNGEDKSVVTLTGSVFGFTAGGEVRTGKLAVGEYSVTADVSQLTAKNYSFAAAAPVSFSVTKAPLAITVSMEKTEFDYGFEPFATVSHSQLVSGDTEESVFGGKLAVQYVTEGGEPVQKFNAGNYKAKANYTEDTQNYTVTANEIPFTVKEAELTVKLKPVSSVLYGNALTMYDPEVSGLVLGEANKRAELISGLKFYYTSDSGRVLLEKTGDNLYEPENGAYPAVGHYTITAEREEAFPNYHLNFVFQQIEITPRPFLISAYARYSGNNEWTFSPALPEEYEAKFSVEGTLAINNKDVGDYIVQKAEDLNEENGIYWATPFKITLSGVDVTSNFEIGYNVKVTIIASRFTVQLPSRSEREFSYDKTEHSFQVVATVKEEDAQTSVPSYEYTVNGEPVDEVKIKDVGIYRVVCKVSAKNYTTETYDFTVTVKKAQGVIDTEEVQKEYTYTGEPQTVTGGATTNNNEDGVLTYSNNTFTTVPEGNALNVTVTLSEGKNYTGATVTFKIHVNKQTVDKMPDGVVYPVIPEQVYGQGKTLAGVEIPDGKFTWKNEGDALVAGTHAYAALYEIDPDNINPVETTITFTTRKLLVTAVVTGGEADYKANASANSVTFGSFTLTDEEGKPCTEAYQQYVKLTFESIDLKVGGTYNVKWTLTLTENDSIDLKIGDSKNVTFSGTAVFKWKSVELNGKYYTIEDALYNLRTGQTATVKFNTAFAAKEIAEKVYQDKAYRTLKAGATLLVPYDSSKDASRNVGTGGATNTEPGFNGTTHSPYTGFSLGNTNNCDLTLTVPDGVEIFNEGTLKVGGITTGGNGGAAGAGQTNSGYARIVLGKNAKIDSTGTMTVFGFIEEAAKDNGSKVTVSGGSFTIPFIVIEHRGGTKFSNIYGDMKGSPFNRFYLQNVTCFYEIKAGGELLGHANMYASGGDNATDVAFVGSEKHFIQLKEGAYVTLKYDTGTKVTNWNFYGDVAINALSLSISIASLSTEGILFPLSWYHLFNFHAGEKGTATVDATAQDIKILPGGAIVIGKGVTFKIKKLFVYDVNYKDPAKDQGVIASTFYETGKGEGKLVVDGTLIAESLGGLVQTTGDGATLTVTSASQVSYELVDANDLTWKSYLKSTEGKIWNNDGTISSSQTIEAGTFTSKNGGWITEKSHYIIEYSYGYRTSEGAPDSAPEGAPETNNPAYFLQSGMKLLPASLKGYEFMGWYTDEGFQTKITEIGAEEYKKYQEQGSKLKLYGLFQKLPDTAQNVELTLDTNGDGAALGGKTSVTFDLRSDKLAEFKPAEYTPERAGYNFLGWFKDKSGDGEAVQTLTKEDFAEGGLTLWAKWELKKFTLTVTLEMLSDITGTVVVTIDGKAQPGITAAGTNSFEVSLGSSVQITVTPGDGCELDSIVSSPEGYIVASGDVFKMPEQDITVTVNVVEESSWCLIEGTLIMMADGTQKPVEELQTGDMVLVFNHETGKYEAAPLLYNVHSGNVAEKISVIRLTFSDGTKIGISYQHFFFDLDLNRYVNLSEENVYEFIGHKFAKVNYGPVCRTYAVTLTDVAIQEEEVKYYSPVSVYHTNLISEGLLSHTTWPVLGNPEGFMNYFAYDADMKFNAESMQADIEKYGLYSYEDFKGVLSEEAFYAGPWKYFKVAVGKGNLSWSDILAAIDWLYHSGQLNPL